MLLSVYSEYYPFKRIITRICTMIPTESSQTTLRYCSCIIIYKTIKYFGGSVDRDKAVIEMKIIARAKKNIM